MMTPAAAGLKTFILEDDADTREAMTLALQRAGFDVESASSVGGALVKIERGLMPHAAIIDLKLPDASGGIVLWRLRRRNPQMHIAVVTGMPDAQNHPELRKEPPDKLFTKPLDLAALVAWLRSVS